MINGAKMWISMANYAKVALIFAQTDPELGHKGIACFIVDTDQPGFQTQVIEHKMGLHASDTASISLEDVEVVRRGDARAGRRGVQSGDVQPRLRALLGRVPAASASARAAWRSR